MTRTPDDLGTIMLDGQRIANRLIRRLVEAHDDGDAETVRWVWKRLLAIERDAQQRDALTGAGLER